MASEACFEVVDTESRIIWSEVTDQDVGNIDHKHSQIGRIVNRELVDVHKIFQSPKLFGVAEVEFDLERPVQKGKSGKGREMSYTEKIMKP